MAGLLAARALSPGGGGLDDPELLRLATRLEGHPDNVAACLAGGLTIAWTSAPGAAGGPAGAGRRADPGAVRSGRSACRRQTARGLLPASVPHADAAANAARAALLIAGLTLDPALLMAGTEDLLHQPYRAAAMPATADLIEPAAGRRDPGGRVRCRALGARAHRAGNASGPPTPCRPLAEQTGVAWQVRTLEVDRRGAVVGEPSAVPSQPGGAGL